MTLTGTRASSSRLDRDVARARRMRAGMRFEWIDIDSDSVTRANATRETRRRAKE